MPSGSDEPVPLKFTDSGACPVWVDAVNDAVGATFGGETTTVLVEVLVPPLLSVTVSETVKVPAEVKVREAVEPVAVPPSPKSHA